MTCVHVRCVAQCWLAQLSCTAGLAVPGLQPCSTTHMYNVNLIYVQKIIRIVLKTASLAGWQTAMRLCWTRHYGAMLQTLG